MATYQVYENPQGQHEAVKQGWSWPGFFLGVIWALYKKLWSIGLGTLALFFVLGATGAPGGLLNLAALVAWVIFGVNGNKWREANLLSRGYEAKGVFQADNPEGAVALCIKTKQSVPEGALA